MNTFEFGVVICAYNGEQFICDQIFSILNQDNAICKVILISDDSLTDGTIDILSSLDGKIMDRISITRGPQLGTVHNFISAILKTFEEYQSLDWLFISDQDDIWCNDKVYQYLSAIKSIDNSKPILICSDSFVVDEHGNELSSSFFNYQGLSIDVMRDDSILFKNCVQGASVALNREMVKLLKQSLDIVDIKKIVMHDWWLAILAKYYGEVVFLDKPLLKYRQHGNNQVGARKRSNRVIQVMRSPIKYAKSLIKTFNQAMAFFTLDMSLNQGISFKLENNGRPALNIKYIGLTKKILVKIMVFLYFFRF